MRVAMTCYGTDQGLGHLAKSFYDAGVIDEVVLVHHQARRTHVEWFEHFKNKVIHADYGHVIGGAAVHELLSQIDVMLFFETPFDWGFAKECRVRGVKTVMMPMYEWYPIDKPDAFDLYLCPSLLDVQYFPGGKLFIPPVDPNTWKLRKTVRRYLHNAGNVGSNGHKGTLELLQAAQYFHPDIQLYVRCQDLRAISQVLQDVPEIRDNPQVIIDVGTVPYDQLFSEDFQAYVAPEKYNGLSLPLQEAFAAGMLVITTDRFPANTWLPIPPLIPPASYTSNRISSNYLEFSQAIVSPKAIADKMNEWHNKDISDYSLAGQRWALEHSWHEQRSKLLAIFEDLLK